MTNGRERAQIGRQGLVLMALLVISMGCGRVLDIRKDSDGWNKFSAGQAYLKEGKPDLAVQSFSYVTDGPYGQGSSSPFFLDCLKGLAASYKAMGEKPEAAAKGSETADRIAATESPENEENKALRRYFDQKLKTVQEAMMKEALNAYQSREFPKALKIYNSLERSSFVEESARIGVANCNAAMGNYDEALATFQSYPDWGARHDSLRQQLVILRDRAERDKAEKAAEVRKTQENQGQEQRRAVAEATPRLLEAAKGMIEAQRKLGTLKDQFDQENYMHPEGHTAVANALADRMDKLIKSTVAPATTNFQGAFEIYADRYGSYDAALGFLRRNGLEEALQKRAE